MTPYSPQPAAFPGARSAVAEDAFDVVGIRREFGAPGPRLDRGSELENFPVMDYRKIITIEPGKRSGKPCIRGLRITVIDVLEYLAGA